MKITKDSTIEEILCHPRGSKVLSKYKVPCLSCPMAAGELSYLKIDEVARIYDLDLAAILKEINNE